MRAASVKERGLGSGAARKSGRKASYDGGVDASGWFRSGYEWLEPFWVEALRYELLVLIGWLAVFWAIGAASFSGFVLTSFFVVLAIVKAVKISISRTLERMPKGSVVRHYVGIALAVSFYLLLASRACYVAMAVVDAVGRGGI